MHRPARAHAGFTTGVLALITSLVSLVGTPCGAQQAAPTDAQPAAASSAPPAAQPSPTGGPAGQTQTGDAQVQATQTEEGQDDGSKAEETPGGQVSPASLGLVEVVPAVWYERDLRFAYIGRTSFYSCSGLKSKVTQILGQMGVKPGFKVSIGSCYEGTRSPQPMPSVRIHAAFPTAATPAVLAELEKTSPERELIRRAQGLPTDFDPALDTFTAVHTTILFKDGRLGPIDPGDCELIQTMRDEVFKPVGMKIVEDHIRCIPGEVTMGSIFMKVEILEQPRPVEKPGAGEKPGEDSQERKVKVETDTPIPPP